MARYSFVTGHGCTFTKSYTVLAWQLTTANVKHVLSLGRERQSARDSPDRTNMWRGNSLLISSYFTIYPCPVISCEIVSVCRVKLIHHSLLCCSSGGLCWFVCNVYPMVFQVYKHINMEAGRETRTRHATYYSWWEIGKDPSLFNVTHQLVFVWSTVPQLRSWKSC